MSNKIQMETVQLVKLKNLSKKHIENLSHLIYPAMDFKKKSFVGEKKLFAVVALMGKERIGLIIAELNEIDRAKIISLKVVLRFRNKGVASNMIRAIESMMASNSIKKIKINKAYA